MDRSQCIAVCGRRRAGKDTIAEILCGNYGFVNHKFARPLKDAVRALFGLETDHVDGAYKDVVHPRWGVTPRAIMQWFGTDVMQHGLSSISPGTGRTFWSDQLRETLVKEQQNAKVVVSDLRFPHELQMLRELYANRLITIRVVRDDDHRRGAGDNDDDDAHESETNNVNLEVDCEILNNGTKADLHDLIKCALSDPCLSCGSHEGDRQGRTGRTGS